MQSHTQRCPQKCTLAGLVAVVVVLFQTPMTLSFMNRMTTASSSSSRQIKEPSAAEGQRVGERDGRGKEKPEEKWQELKFLPL